MSSSKPEIRFTNKASRDLLVILTFTNRQWGERQLHRYRRCLESGLEHIQAHPQLGTVDNPHRPSVHRLVIEQHIVFYEMLDAEIILVLRVLQKRMDFAEWETVEWVTNEPKFTRG